jgi:hypothetical protein
MQPLLHFRNQKYLQQTGLVGGGPAPLCSAQSGRTNSMRVAISASGQVAKHPPGAGMSSFRSCLFGMKHISIRRS